MTSSHRRGLWLGLQVRAHASRFPPAALARLMGGAMTIRLWALTVMVAFACGAMLTAQDDALVEKGRKLYTANKCQTCHSIEGKGNKKGPLDGVGSKLTEEELRAWLVDPKEMTAKTKSTRKPLMKSYEKLPKEDIDALVAYMQSLKKQ